MAIITIRGRKVDVDIERELSRFSWNRARWTADRLVACSPFRYDSTPSFYVYLNDTPTAFAGSWGDSGGSGEWKKGHFTQLLAFLMGVTEAEAAEYLLSEYSDDWDGESELTLNMSRLRMEERNQALNLSLLDQFSQRNDYLSRRGISKAVQRLMRTGYDEKRQAVAIPWFYPDGRLANIKYRRTDSKIFYYHDGGVPMRNLVYGIDVVHAKRLETVILTEAEIDAMYAMTCAKMGAIAVGTSKLSDEKAEMILRSTIKRIKVATDNDKAGRGLREQIIEKLGGIIDLEIVHFPDKYKDLNDIKNPLELKHYIEAAKATMPRLFYVAG